MDPQRLLEEFAAEYRREGSADPRPYLERVDGADRTELQVLIEGFLERAPRQGWDPDAFRGSAADRALRRAAAAEPAADAAGWPELLPALRDRARLSRRAVVQRLAASIGFPAEEERVAAYYHRMERGELRPSGVSSRVTDALATILGAGADALRRSGESGQRAAESGGEVFARVGSPLPTADQASLDPPPQPAPAEPADALDLLFTGGDDVRR